MNKEDSKKTLIKDKGQFLNRSRIVPDDRAPTIPVKGKVQGCHKVTAGAG